MRLALILKVILLVVIGLGTLAVAYYAGYEKGKRVPLSSTPTLTPSTTLSATHSPASAVALEKPCEQSEDKLSCFASYVSQNPLSDDIVKSDDILKEYFSKNLDTLTFTGISRGKFDKYSDSENVILSFNPKNESGEGALPVPVYYFIIQEKERGKWQTFYQQMDSKPKQTTKYMGGFEIITNKPKQLVKNEPQFFIGAYDPIMVGTCVSSAISFNLYRLEKGNFKLIWSVINSTTDYGYGGYGKKGNTTLLETEINFKDVDSDGNLEIIQVGDKKTRRGGCDNDQEQFRSEKIYNFYKWNSQRQNFIKAN